jgi:hypothetical protein
MMSGKSLDFFSHYVITHKKHDIEPRIDTNIHRSYILCMPFVLSLGPLTP